MKRTFVIAATSVFLYSGLAAAQQATSQSEQSQSSGASQQAPRSSGASGEAAAPVAGRAPIGTTVIEMEKVIVGWSAKADFLGQNVVNDTKERIGRVEDIILTSDNYVSYVIVGVGGFLGMGKHDVAIPMRQFRLQKGADLVLPGATKDALKALPKFEPAARK